MQRRARIKAVANLSTSRRSANKSSSEIFNNLSESEIQSEIAKPDDGSNLEKDTEVSKSQPKDNKQSNTLTVFNDVNIQGEDENSLNKKPKEQISSEPLPEAVEKAQDKCSFESPNTLQLETATFKTPLQIPRVDGEPIHALTSVPSSIKPRRFKIAPRLIASRNPIKAQEAEESEKMEEEQVEVLQPRAVETLPDFTLPTPTKVRPETPREVSEQPSFFVNHNIQHSGAPPSPFPYLSHGHSRIRTESLCSMKSNRDITVANLQPRKNIRTEDQKIIDIKRESRERLSNKDLDKSQLTMFDMIYFNPQNNPMKPRDTHKTEKPKKVEVVPEVVEPTPAKKEPSSIPVPQLRIDANGDMVLDETSLIVENEQQKQNRILLATTDVVYDDELSGNYGHYKRQQRTKEWQQDETVKFYRCLNMVGPDFSLMLNMFPNRSRRDLKLKFKKEERNNPQLIDKALLKHSTFDLDGLQREFDQEEEEKKKEAEEKSSSEVKELVKQKILKKQQAKLKANSNIEKILADGELAYRIVGNLDLKENLELDAARTAVPVNKKRQYRKNTKTETIVDESEVTKGQTTNMMEGLNATISSEPSVVSTVPKKARQPRKKPVLSNAELVLNSSNEQEPPKKKPRSALKKSLVMDFIAQLNDSMEGEDSSPSKMKQESAKPDIHFIEVNSSSSEVSKPEKHSLSVINDEVMSEHHWKVEQPYYTTVSEVAQEEIQMEIEEAAIAREMATPASCEGIRSETQDQQSGIVESSNEQIQYLEPHVTQIYHRSSQAFNASLELSETEKFGSTLMQTKLPTNSFEILPVVDLATSSTTESQLEKVSSPGKKSEKKPKQRKKKIRPVLVSRLKLDKDGEMVLDDSSVMIQAGEKCSLSTRDNLSEANEEAFLSNEIPVDENLNETLVKLESSQAPVMITIAEETPSTSSCEMIREEFDGEAFLNSLDLERLVLVEAQRDGKDVFEIHEIDPDSHEIGEKPLDLPSRYVDLIINVMTQQEEEES